MKKICAIAASLTLATAAAVAAPVPNRAPAREAEGMFKDVKDLAAATSDVATRLERLGMRTGMTAQSHIAVLNQMRDGANSMGREIVALDAERNSLEGWESEVLDKVEPLLKEVAANTERAIEYFNTHGNFLEFEKLQAGEKRLATAVGGSH